MLMLKKGYRSGFTLIELVFTMTLVLVLAGLSLWALRPGKSSAPARGLATALAEEFEAARQLAIATGRPVAVGLPTDKGATPAASSLYRLEGWNKPIVTSSRGFSGDYPHLVFLAARWEGPSFSDGLAPSPLSKFLNFQLGSWVPNGLKDDYIFCFTPDGGLVTNGQPALEGRYTVVIAESPRVTGSAPNQRVIAGANSAITLFISPSGGVELVTGLPGATSLGPGTTAVSSSNPQARTTYGAAGATVKISKIRVLPSPADVPADQGICVPGQVVTLEVYAYDPEGRALFSKWTQTADDGTPPALGQFSYPYSDVNEKLTGEVDKMEYVYDLPDDLEWMDGSGPPAGSGAFRARWNWTVPISSQPGDRYKVQADVKDVKGEVTIANPPEETFTTPPTGRMLVERWNGSIWQLVLMNPDGSGEKVLSPPGVEEVMPSLDRSGTKMAFLQGELPDRYVKVRNLHGGPEKKIGVEGNYTSISISPDGAWVSYRDQSLNKIITARVDDGPSYSDDQNLDSTTGHTIKKSRSGWSQDSRYVLFEDSDNIMARDLSNSASIPKIVISGPFTNTVGGTVYSETPYAPITYSAPGGERLLLSLGNNNPVLINLKIDPGNYSGTEIVGGSLQSYLDGTTGPRLRVDYGPNNSTDNDYPSISSDGRFLTFTRSPQTSGMGVTPIPEDVDEQKVWIIPSSGDNFIMGPGGPTVMAQENVRRAIWLPSE